MRRAVRHRVALTGMVGRWCGCGAHDRVAGAWTGARARSGPRQTGPASDAMGHRSAPLTRPRTTRTLWTARSAAGCKPSGRSVGPPCSMPQLEPSGRAPRGSGAAESPPAARTWALHRRPGARSAAPRTGGAARGGPPLVDGVTARGRDLPARPSLTRAAQHSRKRSAYGGTWWCGSERTPPGSVRRRPADARGTSAAWRRRRRPHLSLAEQGPARPGRRRRERASARPQARGGGRG